MNATPNPFGEGSFATRPYICFSGRFDTLVGIQPEAKAESLKCDLQLDPGRTVKGTILDAEGQPLTGVSIRGPFWKDVSIRDLPTSKFTLSAVDPQAPETYFFQHPGKNLGAAIILKGNEPDDFTVKLQPMATITGRLVDEDGEPIKKALLHGSLPSGQPNRTYPWNGFFWGQVLRAFGKNDRNTLIFSVPVHSFRTLLRTTTRKT
jgi:hypothetical protein